MAIGILVAYVIATSLAFYNPARLPQERIVHALQAASIVALLVLHYQRRSKVAVGAAALLAASLALRVSQQSFPVVERTLPIKTEEHKTRWDNAAWFIGMIAVTFTASDRLGLPLLGFCLSAVLVPFALAMPFLVARRKGGLPGSANADAVRVALDVASSAYDVRPIAGMVEPTFIHNTESGTLVVVTRQSGSKTVWVGFAGSDSKLDWAHTNSNVTDSLYGHCTPTTKTTETKETKETLPRVHTGFLQAYDSVRKDILAKIQAIALETVGGIRVVVTGHSLGGALATVAAPDISCELSSVDGDSVSCITFGAPAVGDAAFARLFSEVVDVDASARIVTVYDPIPRLSGSQFAHVMDPTPLMSTSLDPHARSAYVSAIGMTRRTGVVLAFAPAVLVILVYLFLGRVKQAFGVAGTTGIATTRVRRS